MAALLPSCMAVQSVTADRHFVGVWGSRTAEVLLQALLFQMSLRQ